MVKALRAQIDELNAEMAVASAEAERALAEERQRADRLNKQVEALSAEVVGAKKQAEAAVGRAERAEAGRDAERAEADGLRTAIAELKAGQELMIDMHARELAVARQDALAVQEWAAELRRAEDRAEGEGARGAAQGRVEGRMSGQGAPSLQRYPSTADTAPPTPGAWCSSCFGTRWWTERHRAEGLAMRDDATRPHISRPRQSVGKGRGMTLAAPPVVPARIGPAEIRPSVGARSRCAARAISIRGCRRRAVCGILAVGAG